VPEVPTGAHLQHLAHHRDRLGPLVRGYPGRFRRLLGESGVEELLKSTIDSAVGMKAVRPAEFERVTVDSRLLEIARHKVVSAAARSGLALKQTFVKEGKQLRRQAGGYAHAKQFKRLKHAVKRQRTILGSLMRDVQRRLERILQADSQAATPAKVPNAQALADLRKWLERAESIRTQQRHDKNKLYALHAPEVECIGIGKAHKPYEFGVKVSLAVTHANGLMVGARSFPGNPYDGHTLAQQLEQTNTLLEDVGVKPKFAIVDLGYRGLDVQCEVQNVQIIHRGKFALLGAQRKRWLKRRQAIEPAIGHTKHDNRMERCWLQGATGDALHAVLCAAGYNIRWLLRAIAAKGVKGLLFALNEWARRLVPTGMVGQNLSVVLRR
jgi:transposase, IS5 family